MNKKILALTIMLGCAAMVALFCGPATATVTGRCDDCHTMHYSQGGTTLAEWGDSGPYALLLTNDCIGCHTTPTPGDPFDGTTPFVAGADLTDDACLAGGFFPATIDIGTGNNNDDHHGISVSQTNLPAGYDNTGFTYTGAANGLSCAGDNGCHGDDDGTDNLQAISGGHHNESAAYRMLYDAGGLPVESSGAKDYEEAIIDDPSTTVVTSGNDQNVNIYCAGAPTGGKATISELCEKCHGDFHGTDNTGSESPFTRHPTENAIATTWAIGPETYELVGNDYKDNPVGYDAATIDLDKKRVVCMSCHRAHGTQNADLLRWPYTEEMLAGSSVTHGCLGCHDAQR